ncbi:CpsB/CapC family capsule biosynthesis tyrosine phosphatase [Aquabacterium sp.]|uniref:tyrosine-protein phosphatase n=1 Tax=Aquabacterium sp. TaxID=1872578 RepID=UPI0025C47564|nr:CpsB/CapC family capsule biosynthesis tyrosine phosphatase [Aquabacterium sp.]
MIDFHSHILPGIDDGARDLAEALAIARAHVADGTRCVVATPHIYPGVFDNTPATIAAAHATLVAAIADEGIALEIQWAAEVRAGADVIDMLAQGTLPFLGQDGPWRHLLLELPDHQIPVGTDKLVAMLMRQHVKPVIAHPERNKGVMADVQKIKPLVDLGCLLQVTAGSVLGEFGSRAQHTAEQLIDQGWVHALASDAHRTTTRAPKIKPARTWLLARYGNTVADALTLSGPARICQPLVGQSGMAA